MTQLLPITKDLWIKLSQIVLNFTGLQLALEVTRRIESDVVERIL